MAIIVQDKSCNRCGVCADICPMGIIHSSLDGEIPFVAESQAAWCVSCGQCSSFCPTGALTLEKDQGLTPEPAWNGNGLSPELLVSYLKSRRSIRNFKNEPVSRETIEALLDVARYAASGGNGQPVQWLIIHDPEKVQKVAKAVIDWMRTLVGSNHPLSKYIPILITGWENGLDPICRNAPHLLIPHIPEEIPIAHVDGIIALTHVDIAAPAFGVGTCWGGFVALASQESSEIRDIYALPAGRKPLYAMMFGYPKYRSASIPTRNKAVITWQ
ncbi:nitroreductase family protein [Methanospirillum lacunae]|uniref:Nitroreductase n=1 Tax=Methanospirillum lacunae TaxID=668570 RepID=A0A2V2NDY8_9EURY|nr:nitroreductase family protein [Methanospirillum lacunae]PWR73811.1 nitroreductase [Methanospirillum lacunae]